MLRDFIAIDFETANQEPSSVCSVGVVMVRDTMPWLMPKQKVTKAIEVS